MKKLLLIIFIALGIFMSPIVHSSSSTTTQSCQQLCFTAYGNCIGFAAVDRDNCLIQAESNYQNCNSLAVNNYNTCINKCTTDECKTFCKDSLLANYRICKIAKTTQQSQCNIIYNIALDSCDDILQSCLSKCQ